VAISWHRTNPLFLFLVALVRSAEEFSLVRPERPWRRLITAMNLCACRASHWKSSNRAGAYVHGAMPAARSGGCVRRRVPIP